MLSRYICTWNRHVNLIYNGIQDFLFVFLVLLTFISIVSSKGFHGDPESQAKTVNALSPTLQWNGNGTRSNASSLVTLFVRGQSNSVQIVKTFWYKSNFKKSFASWLSLWLINFRPQIKAQIQPQRKRWTEKLTRLDPQSITSASAATSFWVVTLRSNV